MFTLRHRNALKVAPHQTAVRCTPNPSRPAARVHRQLGRSRRPAPRLPRSGGGGHSSPSAVCPPSQVMAPLRPHKGASNSFGSDSPVLPNRTRRYPWFTLRSYPWRCAGPPPRFPRSVAGAAGNPGYEAGDQYTEATHTEDTKYSEERRVGHPAALSSASRHKKPDVRPPVAPPCGPTPGKTMPVSHRCRLDTQASREDILTNRIARI